MVVVFGMCYTEAKESHIPNNMNPAPSHGLATHHFVANKALVLDLVSMFLPECNFRMNMAPEWKAANGAEWVGRQDLTRQWTIVAAVVRVRDRSLGATGYLPCT